MRFNDSKGKAGYGLKPACRRQEKMTLELPRRSVCEAGEEAESRISYEVSEPARGRID